MLVMIAHTSQASSAISPTIARPSRAWCINVRRCMIGRVKTLSREEPRYVHLVLHLNARTSLWQHHHKPVLALSGGEFAPTYAAVSYSLCSPQDFSTAQRVSLTAAAHSFYLEIHTHACYAVATCHRACHQGCRCYHHVKARCA